MTSRIISVANQKGGVGKTTTTLGLAAAVGHSGRRVLIVDMDPQFNATSTLLPDYSELASRDDFFTTNDLMEQGVDAEDVIEAIRPTAWANVDVIPSERALANRDLEGSTGIEVRLNQVLKGLALVDPPYDVVLIDCPPSVGRLTVNSLRASAEVLFVAGPDRYSQGALHQIGETLRVIENSYDSATEVVGLIVNMFENTNEATERTEQLREQYGDRLLMVMPKRTVISRAAGQHKSVFDLIGQRADAREVATMYESLARSLRLIGRREALPAVEDVAAEDRPEIDPQVVFAEGEGTRPAAVAN